MNPWLTSIPFAYLLGSIPFGYLLVRTFRHQDIRSTGSGNIGATNVARSGAKGLAVATLLFDLLKGVAAVILAFQISRHSGIPSTGVLRQRAFEVSSVAAVAAVVGHVFPVWLAFRGGKGVATALGVFAVLAPRATLCAVTLFLIIFALTRYVSLASIVSAASFPIFAFRFVPIHTRPVLFSYLFIPLLVIGKHRANIGRLLAGTEPRFGRKSKVVAA